MSKKRPSYVKETPLICQRSAPHMSKKRPSYVNMKPALQTGLSTGIVDNCSLFERPSYVKEAPPKCQ